MTKLIASLLLALIPFTTIFAQANPSADFIENFWTYKEISPGNVQEEVEKNFRIQFKEDGTGHLTLTLTFTTKGQDIISYYGMVKFSYAIMDDNDDPSRTAMELNYGQLTLEPMHDIRRDIKEHDEMVKIDLIDKLSNKTVDYYLQRTGQYLVVEGFEQNEQSQFTYFTSARAYRN